MESFGNHSKGFRGNASHLESFGRRYKWILLEGLTIGILWKRLQEDSAGRPRNWNPSGPNPNRCFFVEGLTTGIHWTAPQGDSKGKPHNWNPSESITKFASLQTDTVGRMALEHKEMCSPSSFLRLLLFRLIILLLPFLLFLLPLPLPF